MIDPVILAAELINDPSHLDYGAVAAAARQATPDDSGAQDVAVAAILNADNQTPTQGTIDRDSLINAFTDDEWFAAKQLVTTNATICKLFDRLTLVTSVMLGGTAFGSGIEVLVSTGTIPAQRAQEIQTTLFSILPQTSRASQLGIDFVTPSDVANARRQLAGGPDKDPIELGK